MPRGERPLDGVEDNPLVRFAGELRALRVAAGSPPYRELARRTHYSASALSDAAGGRKLPSLEVTLAYVRACDGDVAQWEQRWHALAATTEPAGDDTTSPYVGLGAFQVADADRFFGRERLVEELLGLLADRRFVTVFGASGSGKSSLLRAGLLPRLSSAALITPGEPLPDADVVVVDQFEEVFTGCRDADAFIDAVVSTSRQVVVAVRADFFAHCIARPVLAERIREAQVPVGPMTAEELRRAVVQPAAAAGCAVEGALQTAVVAEAAGQAGVLPLLSHALRETWRRRRGNTLTLAGFTAVGGLTGALARTAEAVFGALTDRQRELARGLFLRLIALGDGTEDTRRHVPHGELDDDPDLTVVLERYTAARLLTADGHGVDLAHEALIQRWPRLRDWLADDREGRRLHRQLTEATSVWETLGRDTESLYRGTRLRVAREWAARHHTELTVRERRFLDAGHALETRRARRARQLVALLVVLLVVAAGGAAVAVRAERGAAHQRDVALSQIVAGKAVALRRTDPALAAQLSLAAYRLSPTADARDSLLGSFPIPDTARLTGHTGHVNTVAFGPDGRTIVTASHDHTARLWRDGHEVAVLTGHGATVNAAAFSPDGTRVATASWDRTARLWDAGSSETRSVLSGHTREVNAVAFSADSRLVATASTDATVKLWDGAAEVATLTGHTDAVVSVAFSPQGNVVATGGWDHLAGVWRDPAHPVFLTGHTAPVVWVAFSPDGGMLATASQDNTVRLWDMTTLRELSVLRGHEAAVRSVAFRADGRMLATGSQDNTARLWDISDPHEPKQLAMLGGHHRPVVSVAFSPDGHTLATGSDDDTALLWNIPARVPDTADRAAEWICATARPAITTAQWAQYFPGVAFHPPC
ncbi:hypothetical protein Lesp02_44240 [Lentzea sp. NBRC 105346]|uniref:nSTAND1 domain-containing NTPase n=1 Tax=Lentzea sp. NBRC 105346 TaxID=3032205 RepID=UPI0024A481C3|nr:XRE family transcriptional regulator [Lentzea sp. NBRC 105346]GLZ32236.1 hypothetical protein Lesp02_44240 [Lentzea sp. NBRC 105346]